jgi:hypothetical protein
MHEMESVLQCAKCDGYFTPSGGEAPTLADLSAEIGPPVRLSPDAILSEPEDSPLLFKAAQLLGDDETIWAMIPGCALEKTSEVQTTGEIKTTGSCIWR